MGSVHGSRTSSVLQLIPLVWYEVSFGCMHQACQTPCLRSFWPFAHDLFVLYRLHYGTTRNRLGSRSCNFYVSLSFLLLSKQCTPPSSRWCDALIMECQRDVQVPRATLRSSRMTGRNNQLTMTIRMKRGCYAPAGARMASKAVVRSVARACWVSGVSLAPWLVR